MPCGGHTWSMSLTSTSYKTTLMNGDELPVADNRFLSVTKAVHETYRIDGTARKILDGLWA